MAEEERYNNRQIERLLDEQSRDLKAYFDSKTEPILVQTTKTNGRVTKLEGEIFKSKTWQAYVIGFCACVSILILSIGIPILSAYISAGKF